MIRPGEGYPDAWAIAESARVRTLLGAKHHWDSAGYWKEEPLPASAYNGHCLKCFRSGNGVACALTTQEFFGQKIL